MMRPLAALTCAAALVQCSSLPIEQTTQVLVVGGGIAGISAALEAANNGASVTVLEANSVAGGHAVMAGGFYLVDTALQRKRRIEDSPELAAADLLAWGENADEYWVRRYAGESGSAVYEWLTEQGVEFRAVLPTPGETSVPRFHFTRGTAVHAVVPLLQKVIAHPQIELVLNTRITGIRRDGDESWRLTAAKLREGGVAVYRADAVIIAAGGFEGDLQQVRTHWPQRFGQPGRLLNGAGHFANGDSLGLARQAGSALERLDAQTIFVSGIPNPLDPGIDDGWSAQNSAAILVNARGQRFVNEAALRKQIEVAVLETPEQTGWLIFDARGSRRLTIRGAPWLSPAKLREAVLDNAQLASTANTITELARHAGLPAGALKATVANYNRALDDGTPDQLGRFGAERNGRRPQPIIEPPFYALKLYPLSRKSMGGIAIDEQARAIDAAGQALPGLYAAGEATGVAGINGRYGGSGTFLGPSVFLGRIAGAQAAARVGAQAGSPKPRPAQPGAASRPTGQTSTPAALEALLKISRPGYWHFEQSHRVVLDQRRQCADCHGPGWGLAPAVSRAERNAQLASCAQCH